MGLTKDEFYERVDIDDKGCWVWQGYINPNGYGRVGRHDMAHRVAYELWIGPIRPRAQIEHRCSNKACVNPEHLEAVSQSVNRLRDHARRYGQHSRRVNRVARWLHNEVTGRIDRTPADR